MSLAEAIRLLEILASVFSPLREALRLLIEGDTRMQRVRDILDEDSASAKAARRIRERKP